jgi:hypothetical protein
MQSEMRKSDLRKKLAKMKKVIELVKKRKEGYLLIRFDSFFTHNY